MALRPRCLRPPLSVLAVLCLTLVGAPGAIAQPPELPRLFGAFHPELGVWSEYQVVEQNGKQATKMRMAIVGQEQGAFWYEVTHDEGDNRNVIKMLVRGNPNEPENIQRLIIKSGAGPAQEMPRDFVAMGRKMAVHMFEKRSGIPSGTLDKVQVKDIGTRKVTVVAGTFTTTQHQIVDAQGKQLAEYDSNPDVLPFGVIRSTTDSSTMELLAYGGGATSQIREQPQLMVTPPGMPAGMPRGAPPGMPPPAARGPKP